MTSVVFGTGVVCAIRRKRRRCHSSRHGRVSRVVARGREPRGDAGRRSGLAGARDGAVQDDVAAAADLDVRPRREHAQADERVEPGAAPERLRNGVRIAGERGVDALEELRAERRVGRDVSDEEARRREPGEHEQQRRRCAPSRPIPTLTPSDRVPTAWRRHAPSPERPAPGTALRPPIRFAQHVADQPNRVDQRRPDAVELAPEVAHVGLHDVGVAAEVVVPDVVEDLPLAQHPAGILE